MMVNEVLRQYNGLGQLTTEFQASSGAVNVLTTPKVQYAYTEMAGAANHSRMISMTYPNGRVLTSNYAAGIDNSISRLSSLSDSTGTLESYSYLGLGTIINRSLTLAGVDQTKIKLTAEAVSDSQDAYTGLDRFGRVINQRWLKTSNSTNVDRFAYGYDRNSNRTYRENLSSTTNSELYAYDNLDRITSFQRGTLNAAKTALTGSATRSQSWVLDALGNSTSVTTNGVVQNRTHNRQNELTQVGATNLAFDNNGDLTTDQNGKTLIYDAWNRVVEQKTGAVSNITFAYDAMNRRIKEGATVVYFSSAWQAIEERNSSNVAQVQYTWSAAYIDAMIARDRDTDNNGSLEQRIYVMQDANWNITAITNSTGAVVERFQYDAYGKQTVLSPTFVAASDTFVFNHGFAGGKADTVTGRVNFRNREYDVDLMRWTTMDPIGFAAGDMNWYQYVGAGPTGAVDPSGLADWFKIFGIPPSFGSPYADQYAQNVAPELYKPYDWHFDRNRFNNPPPTEVEARGKGWRKLPDWQSQYHQCDMPPGKKNSKYLSSDGHQEAVYGPDGNIVTHSKNAGTYNYGPEPVSFDHVILDILPYKFYGNGPNK